LTPFIWSAPLRSAASWFATTVEGGGEGGGGGDGGDGGLGGGDGVDEGGAQPAKGHPAG